MAVLPRALVPRQYYNGDYYDNPFNNYGRWIVLVAIVIGVFFIFLLFSCITARRRRSAGLNPYRGTGWAAGRTPPGHAPAQYNPQPSPFYAQHQQQNFAPTQNPPIYSPPANTYYSGQNQGYFGGQQAGIELQQPNQAYQPPRGGEPVYTPPAGPPPGKKDDGIIR